MTVWRSAKPAHDLREARRSIHRSVDQHDERRVVRSRLLDPQPRHRGTLCSERWSSCSSVTRCRSGGKTSTDRRTPSSPRRDAIRRCTSRTGSPTSGSTRCTRVRCNGHVRRRHRSRPMHGLEVLVDEELAEYDRHSHWYVPVEELKAAGRSALARDRGRRVGRRRGRSRHVPRHRATRPSSGSSTRTHRSGSPRCATAA